MLSNLQMNDNRIKPDNNIIKQICANNFGTVPNYMKRCAIGQGNYVYTVKYDENTYIVRCSLEKDVYEATRHWLNTLSEIDIPIPKVICKGQFGGFDYLILTYIEGVDIGEVYLQLTADEKKRIAKEIVTIQNKVSSLYIETESNWSWYRVIYGLLDRAKGRIIENGLFDVEKSERLRQEIKKLESYFSKVKPEPYLDDISTKNLLIYNGQISGIVDIDEMGFGDKLSYVALTYMALLNHGYNTDYVDYILAEMQLDADAKKAFLFYALVYCVDFMGERGMHFMDKQVEASPQVIDRLNGIYDKLWRDWNSNNKPSN